VSGLLTGWTCSPIIPSIIALTSCSKEAGSGNIRDIPGGATGGAPSSCMYHPENKHLASY
jgi:hypothetical protein